MIKAASSIAILCICFAFGSFVSTASAKTGAEMHVAKGVPCQTCHGPDLQKPKEPSDKTCLGCHNRDALIEKTKDLHPVVNPHNPPHNGECIQCHLQHSDPVNNCADCHKYEFKMKAIQ